MSSVSRSRVKKARVSRKTLAVVDKTALLERIVEAVCDVKTSGDAIFALAQECDAAGLPKQEAQLIEFAARAKGHVHAAFVHACNEMHSPTPSIEFLVQHCAVRRSPVKPFKQMTTADIVQLEATADVTVNPQCLTLLAQLMESNEFGLTFDPDIAGELLQRAIGAGTFLKEYSDKSNANMWALAVLRATYERVRLILDYGIDQTKDRPDWQVAHEQFAHLGDDARLVAMGALDTDLLDVYVLRARIADQAGRAVEAVDLYRRALTIAKKCKEPCAFINARLAALTPDFDEAAALLPQAMAWLDDKGVGANDSEMPDLVARYAAFVARDPLATAAAKEQATQRVAALTKSSTPTLLSPVKAAVAPILAPVATLAKFEPTVSSTMQNTLAPICTSPPKTSTAMLPSVQQIFTSSSPLVTSSTSVSATRQVSSNTAPTAAQTGHAARKVSYDMWTDIMADDTFMLPPLHTDKRKVLL
jgi:hypothetical protein